MALPNDSLQEKLNCAQFFFRSTLYDTAFITDDIQVLRQVYEKNASTAKLSYWSPETVALLWFQIASVAHVPKNQVRSALRIRGCSMRGCSIRGCKNQRIYASTDLGIRDGRKGCWNQSPADTEGGCNEKVVPSFLPPPTPPCPLLSGNKRKLIIMLTCTHHLLPNCFDVCMLLCSADPH